MSVFSALLNNGPLQVGPLADRGAFDQYASYRPGQVVVDDGVVYLNIAAIGAAPELEDTFARRDQQGWGQSSRGEVWQTGSGWAHAGPPSIQANQGVLRAGTESVQDGQLLGPSRTRADAEVLLRMALGVVPEASTYNGFVALTATEDGASYAGVQAAVSQDGTTQLQVQATADPDVEEDGVAVAGPTLTDGAAVWLRLRRIGLVYTASMWPVGTVEPSTPQATLTATHAQPAGHPLVFLGADTVGQLVAISTLSVRPLTAADAPGDDTDHWVALADALQVPQPL